MNKQAIASVLMEANEDYALGISLEEAQIIAGEIIGAIDKDSEVTKKRESIELSLKSARSQLAKLEAELQTLRDSCPHLSKLHCGESLFQCESCGEKLVD